MIRLWLQAKPVFAFTNPANFFFASFLFRSYFGFFLSLHSLHVVLSLDFSLTSRRSPRRKRNLSFTLCRQTYLWVLLEVMLLRANPSRDQMIFYAMSQSKIVVTGCCNITILDEREVEMAIESFLHFADVLNLCNAAHWNLLALVNIANGFAHDCTS